MDTPRVVDKKVLQAGRFIDLKVIDWVDANGVARKWESAERAKDAGAVVVIARLRPSDRVVFVRQFRPPTGRQVIEFPAGLVNPDEDPTEAGVREVKEETGYVAAVSAISPPAYTSAGLTNETVCIAFAEIDETAPENAHPETDFDATEMIETILVPFAELGAFYRRELAAGGAFDARVATWILTVAAQS